MGQAAPLKKGQYQRQKYQYDSTVRKLIPQEKQREKERKQLKHTIRKNRERAAYMSLSYVLFLSAAVLATFYICITYLQLNSECTSRIENINSLHSQLSTLQEKNNEEYSRITSSVDLNEIKRIAIEELGMVFASKDQTVLYESEDSDYVKQMQDVPSEKKSLFSN